MPRRAKHEGAATQDLPRVTSTTTWGNAPSTLLQSISPTPSMTDTIAQHDSSAPPSTHGDNSTPSPIDSLRIITASSGALSLDPRFFPHLFDTIIGGLDLQHLIPLRGVCHYLKNRVEPLLGRHIVLVPVKKRVMPGLALQWRPRFPTANFWQSAHLKNSVKIIDFHHNSLKGLPTIAYPQSLSMLPNVDMIRDMAGTVDTGSRLPVPFTREWISWVGLGPKDTAAVIPDVVTEHVVLNLECRPPPEWQDMLPAGPFHITIAFLGVWWWVDHEGECGSLEWDGFCTCQECEPCDYGECDSCRDQHHDAYDVICEMCLLLALQLEFYSVLDNQPISITLVDFAMFASAIQDRTAQELEEWLVDLIVTMIDKDHITHEFVAAHISFPTLEEQQESLGDELFTLRHKTPRYWPSNVPRGLLS